MTLTDGTGNGNTAGFRTRLFATVMLIVCALTAFGIYLARVRVTSIAEHDLQRNFEDQLFWVHKVQALRRAIIAERVRAFASNPRIDAALEDDALDLLYPTAKDELRGFLAPSPERATQSLHASFCRFLDSKGAVIPPPKPAEVGDLSPAAEEELALPRLPVVEQLGYVPHLAPEGAGVDEVVVVPIYSSGTGEVISALLAGFKPLELGGKDPRAGMKSGIWVDDGSGGVKAGVLDLPLLPPPAHDALAATLSGAIQPGRTQGRLTVTVEGAPHLLFYKRLYADSLFPPAYEVCIYPLADSVAQLHRAWWRIGIAGSLLLAAGLVIANLAAVRLAGPVEQLAVDSETNRVERTRAEAALQRSERFSGDASHQLKNPLAILRAGIEKLMAHEGFSVDTYEELSTLLHQTFRLAGVIDDLLLLSRMDAGHLRIDFKPVNLVRLMEGWIDDLSALPGAPTVKVERNMDADISVAAEERYVTLIVQNLLENAQKYNRPGGRIEISVNRDAQDVVITIGNTGRPIPREAQRRLFERFQTGSGVAGHGLGLNLARELARLHGGDLRLIRSQDDWTGFELRLRSAAPQPSGVP